MAFYDYNRGEGPDDMDSKPTKPEKAQNGLESLRERRRTELAQLTKSFTLAMTGRGNHVSQSTIRKALDMATYLFSQVDAQVDREFGDD